MRGMAAGPQSTRRERRERARAEREERERQAAAAEARKRRLYQLGGLVALAAVVVIVAIVVSSGGNSSTPTKKAGENVPGQSLVSAEFDGIPQANQVLGNPKAAHTLVEFGDLVCPACKAYSDQIIPTIVQNYVRTGKLRMEFRPFGFIRPYSERAAEYAWAAGKQNKLWNFSKLWYLNQLDENDNYVNDAFARKIGSGVPGLDVNRLIADSKTAAAKQQADTTAQQFQAFGFDATPSFAAGTTGGTLKSFDIGQSASDANAAVGKLVGGGT
jgi:protein-disulfide isomerase